MRRVVNQMAKVDEDERSLEGAPRASRGQEMVSYWLGGGRAAKKTKTQDVQQQSE